MLSQSVNLGVVIDRVIQTDVTTTSFEVATPAAGRSHYDTPNWGSSCGRSVVTEPKQPVDDNPTS
jgi:hypothetical protein